MISRTPSNSSVAVTHSDSEAWLAADADIMGIWPEATGYTYITAFEGWPNWNGPNVALLWEVFGPDCPGPDEGEALRAWAQAEGAVKRAQHVFLLPDVLDIQPLLIYRALTVPSSDLVETAVARAQRIREEDEFRTQRKREIFGLDPAIGNNGEPDRPFDQEDPS